MRSDGRTDLIWMLFLVTTGLLVTVVVSTHIFDATVLLSGIVCVGLIAVGRREGYLIGLYNSVSYAMVAYENGLFGEVYLNLFFFVPTGVLGYFHWQRHTTDRNTVDMRALGTRARIVVGVACVIATLGLGWLLQMNPSQNTPFVDAATNVLSVIATLLMMGRYKEQWVLYILLNVLSIGMWWQRYAAGGESGDLMILMWSLFLLNAMFGAWRWHQGTASKRRVCDGEGSCDVA